MFKDLRGSTVGSCLVHSAELTNSHGWMDYIFSEMACMAFETLVRTYAVRINALTHFRTLRFSNAYKRAAAYTLHAGISARQRTRESVARRKMLQSSTVLNFHALRQRTQAIQPIIYRCYELSLQRIDLAITAESSHWTISSWRRNRKAHVIAVKVQS